MKTTAAPVATPARVRTPLSQLASARPPEGLRRILAVAAAGRVEVAAFSSCL